MYMKKKIFTFCFFTFLLLLITGCTQKTVDPKPKEEKSNRPVADGVAFEATELEFYLPSDFQKSPTNGMLGVYEYYTGELKDMKATGIDVVVLIDALEEEFVWEDYIQTEAPAVKEGVTLKKKTLNDSDWYVGEQENIHYYYSVFRGNKYEVTIQMNDDSKDLYEDTIQMFEKTMYFEELEAN